MPRIDKYNALASLAADDELIAWDTSAGEVVNVTPPVLATRLATDSAFSSQYGTTTAQSIWVPAGAIGPGPNGSPALGITDTAAAYTGWLLDAASTESISVPLVPPSHWATFAMDLYWTNAGVGSGNVVMQIYTYTPAGNGEAMTSGITTGLTVKTIAAPARNVLKVTSTTAFTSSTAAGKMSTFYVQREGADPGDTLANDIAVLGVLVRRLDTP